LCEADTISILMTAIVSRKLAVDVGNDSGLRGARESVSGDDLIAKGGKNAGVPVA
jgi:hypothetical protein